MSHYKQMLAMIQAAGIRHEIDSFEGGGQTYDEILIADDSDPEQRVLARFLRSTGELLSMHIEDATQGDV
jgi:hypothetical protein